MRKSMTVILAAVLCSGLCLLGTTQVQAATGKSTKVPLSSGTEAGNKSEKFKKTEKSEKIDKSEKTNKSEKSDKSEKSKKSKLVKKNKKSSKLKQYNTLKTLPEIETYSEPTEVPVWTAQSSSWLEDDKDYYRYHPDNLFDHDLSTAYVEGVDGDGIGEMVEFQFGIGWEATTYAITQIEIHPGYQKSANVFKNNSRPTRLGFYFPDGSSEIVELGDDYDYDDTFTVDIDPVVTNKCTMVIEDAVTGKKYKDCCISEVTFYSQEISGITYYEREDSSGSEDGHPEADYIIDAYAGELPLWSYKTQNVMTELTSSAYLTSGFGKVIVYDEAVVTALDAGSGEVLWEVKETGFPSACSFDGEGNLYICGYYGSNLTVVDEDGDVLDQFDNLAGEEYNWACMMAIRENGKLSIYYAMYEEDDENGRIFTTEYEP